MVRDGTLFGLTLLKTFMWMEALGLLQQALEHDPYEKTAVQAFAELSMSLGRNSEALPVLRRYLKRHPDDAELSSDLKVLEQAVGDCA